MVQPFQQEDRDQGCPNLDAQGVFGGAHEALHLEVLLLIQTHHRLLGIIGFFELELFFKIVPGGQT
jgi:hypothetical protein